MKASGRLISTLLLCFALLATLLPPSIATAQQASVQAKSELTRKQMNIGGTVDYGFGWFLRQWNGHKVVEHGGNIDGFNSQVAFSDYRNVDGIMVAFKNMSSNIANGDSIVRIVDIKFDVNIPDAVFQKPANPPKRTDQ